MNKDESITTKVSISVLSAIIASMLAGSIIVYTEFLHIQSWSEQQKALSIFHVARLDELEDLARKGNRWTLEEHNHYAEKLEVDLESQALRISTLEVRKAATDARLQALEEAVLDMDECGTCGPN